ncbi:MAG: ABC transporter ATP-binding protein, partial [Alphaproteobacteria bacterium]|nr:ABC transporter ATP-binding protein [Alphaproteobacteria bacterium]
GAGFAKVLASRLLGRASLIHLCTCQTEGREVHLHARVPGQYLPPEGSIQALSVNKEQVFIFPA